MTYLQELAEEKQDVQLAQEVGQGGILGVVGRELCIMLS